jgi:hypothetical protein
MSVVRGLLAFLMSRICERGARNFERVSSRGELYAVGVLGVLMLLVLLSAALFLNAWLPALVEFRSAKFSRMGLALIWAAATGISYVVFVPDGRYRRWSDEFQRSHTMAQRQPALVEVLAIGAVFAVLIASIALNWVTNVLLT